MKKILLLVISFIFIQAKTVNTAIYIDEYNYSYSPEKVQSDPGMDNQAGKKDEPRDLAKEIDELKKRVEDLEERVDELTEKVDDRHKLKINGLFDVSISNYKNKPNVFEIGNFEIHLERNYKEHLQVAAALVFNNGADLAVGFIDYHIFGGSISPRGRLFQEKGIHIQVGKFDVPFGNDWRYVIASNRITVTQPLTTEIIMEEGYNDVGLRLLANFMSFNATAYALRGIEKGYSYGGNSYGGRFGFTPFNNPYTLKSKAVPVFELGASYIYDMDKDGTTAEKMYAFDVESKIGPFILRAEYYNRDKVVGILFEGYQVTAALDFNDIIPSPFILYCRYDYTRSQRYEKFEEVNSLARITGGININIARISYLKLEYIRFLQAYEEYKSDEYFSPNLYYAQLIITF